MANGDPIAYVEPPVLIRIMNKGALAVGAGWACIGYWPVLDQMQM